MKRIDASLLCGYTHFRQSLFFGHVGTENPKTLSKQEFFAKSSGNRTRTHNPKVVGSSLAPAINLSAKRGLEPTTHGS